MYRSTRPTDLFLNSRYNTAEKIQIFDLMHPFLRKRVSLIIKGDHNSTEMSPLRG